MFSADIGRNKITRFVANDLARRPASGAHRSPFFRNMAHLCYLSTLPVSETNLKLDTKNPYQIGIETSHKS